MVVVAVGLITGSLLDQYLLHAFEAFEEDGFGVGEYHERILIAQEYCTGVEF